MIRKITKLKNFGIFNETQWMRDDLEFKKINLLYGFNGSGKTILSNVLRLISSDFIYEDKEEIIKKLKNNEESESEFELFWDNQKINSFSQEKDILVFNSNFVADHISEGKIRKFKGGIVTKEHLENPQIKKIKEKLSDVLKIERNIEVELEKLSDLSKIIYKDVSNQWNNAITGYRLPTGLNFDDDNNVPQKAPEETIQELNEILNDHFRKFKVASNNQDLQNEVIRLEKIEIKRVVFDVNIIDILQKNISKGAYDRVKERLNKFQLVHLKHASIQQWFEDGVLLLEKSKEDKKCPLCNSTIDVVNIIKDYNEFFNKEFIELQEKLSLSKKSIDLAFDLLENNKKDIEKIQNIIYSYNLSEKISNDRIQYLKDFSIVKLKSEFIKIEGAIERKQKFFDYNPTKKDIDRIKNFFKEIEEFNKLLSAITEINKQVLDDLKQSGFSDKEARDAAKNLFWKKLDDNGKEYADKFIKNKLVDITETQFEFTGIEFYRWLKIKNVSLKKDIEQYTIQKNDLLAKLKKESEFVNLFLRHLSVFNLKIKFSEDDEEKIEVVYSNGSTKKNVNYSLSDGEKTALAFAYFLSKIKYEVLENTEKELKNYVVIIDDPVSSLDENRLFSTALLIKNIFGKNQSESKEGSFAQNSKQLFVFSHNLIFLKFLGNILENDENTNREDFYLENGRLLILPKALQNYQTSYFYKIQKLLNFLDNEIDYETAKDFLPNNIRVILEAFLSFKFCRLKLGSSGDKYKSAGLGKLITLINEMNFNNYDRVGDIENQETLIKTLWDIKKKVDPESHGTSQDMIEFEFLSEKELRKISRQTLDVIEFLDQIHIGKIKSM